MNDEEYALKLKQRYQFQPWYIKLWRRRWYLVIPYWTIKAWLNSNNHGFGFKVLWGIYTGMAQSEMEWYYTMDETKERWKKRIDDWKIKNGKV